ncbi:MAG: Sir2 family NAD-dependent protein deacetylase [Bacteroidota bacterium]
MLPDQLKHCLNTFYDSGLPITVLTGAGVSAESGIPTFRGKEGYWQIGSTNYQPQEIGTFHMFRRQPEEVWKWYLFRRTVCHQSSPNAGHMAIVELEKIFGDRFTLITQNVDGLHLRAGNSLERSYLVHGTLEYVRCSKGCTRELFPFPDGIGDKSRETDLTEEEKRILTCPYCGDWTRPHILWFDEYYDEDYYRFESSMKQALETGLLITIGTSGATTLPVRVVEVVLSREVPLIDINIAPNVFGRSAEKSGNGFFLQGSSGTILPEIVQHISLRISDHPGT